MSLLWSPLPLWLDISGRRSGSHWSLPARRSDLSRHPLPGSPLGELDVAERLRGRQVPGRACAFRPPAHALGKTLAATDLALVRFERGDLSIDRPRDVEPDVGVARSEEKHTRHAVLLETAGQLLWEEEVVPRGDPAG